MKSSVGAKPTLRADHRAFCPPCQSKDRKGLPESGAVRTLRTGVSGGFACGQRASEPPSHVGVQSQQFGTTALTVDCRPISLGRICRMGQLGRPGTSPSRWGAGLPGNSGRRSWLGLSGPHAEGLGQTGGGRPSTPVPASGQVHTRTSCHRVLAEKEARARVNLGRRPEAGWGHRGAAGGSRDPGPCTRQDSQCHSVPSRQKPGTPPSPKL